MNYKVAIDQLTKIYNDVKEARTVGANQTRAKEIIDPYFVRTEILINNIYNGLDGDQKLMKARLDKVRRGYEYQVDALRLEKLLDFINRIGEDIRQKEALDKYEKESDKEVTLLKKSITSLEREIQMLKSNNQNGEKSSNFKVTFYITAFLLFTYINFSIPFLLNSVNWNAMILLELAVVVSILVFYFKRIPEYVLFILNFIVAILSILFALKG